MDKYKNGSEVSNTLCGTTEETTGDIFVNIHMSSLVELVIGLRNKKNSSILTVILYAY